MPGTRLPITDRPELAMEFRRLYDQDLTYPQLCEHFGVSRFVPYRWARALGLTPRGLDIRAKRSDRLDPLVGLGVRLRATKVEELDRLAAKARTTRTELARKILDEAMSDPQLLARVIK